jgi:fluoroacetyl-CoA thioesterase
VQPHLGETETTVGTHINVSHAAAARGGNIATGTAELEFVDSRRLNFKASVKARNPDIGEGMRQRAIIGTNRFG